MKSEMKNPLKSENENKSELSHSPKSEGKSKCKSDLRLVEFSEALAEDFKKINYEWVSEMFAMEEADHALLDQPGKIVSDGGEILFVEHRKLGVIGTGALLLKSPGVFELSKMGVLKKARGLKAGEFILQGLIERAKAREATQLFLLTNTKCEAAIHLYLRNGFVHDSETLQKEGGAYSRCDVAMVYS